MPANLNTGLLSTAAMDLGLGGGLQQQVKDETDEERKKRLQLAQQRAMMGPAATMLGMAPGAGLGGGLTGGLGYGR